MTVPRFGGEVAPCHERVVAVGRSTRRQRKNFKTGGRRSALGRGIEMDTDKNRPGIRPVQTPRQRWPRLEGNEHIAVPRHHHPQTLLAQIPCHPFTHVEVEIFFRAETVHRAAVVSAVAGIEHDGAHRLQFGNAVRAHHRIDRLGQIHPRDVILPGEILHRETQPVLHPVETRLPRALGEIHAPRFGLQGHPTVAARHQFHLVKTRHLRKRQVIPSTQTLNPPTGGRHLRRRQQPNRARHDQGRPPVPAPLHRRHRTRSAGRPAAMAAAREKVTVQTPRIRPRKLDHPGARNNPGQSSSSSAGANRR